MRIIVYWDWMTTYVSQPLIVLALLAFVVGLYCTPLRIRFWSFIIAAAAAFSAVTIDVIRAFDANWFYDIWKDVVVGLGGILAVGLAVISGRLIRQKRRHAPSDGPAKSG